ncbi:MAG: glycosyltransferase [Phycisphaerae bacterium]|nr:glycosyltransferase [Phycisphaerae bacterium]MDW8260939.1 glycosyltransferase [Phycisphaerales bacterium]
MRAPGIITLWLLAVLLALPLDAPVAQWMRDSGLEWTLRHDHGLREFLKLPGEAWSVFLAGAVAWMAHPARVRAVALIVLSSLLVSAGKLVKFAVGRHRPFTWMRGTIEELRPFDFLPLRDGMEGFFHDQNLSFPSGHASLAFALAGALAMLWPRGRWVFLTVATLTALERVAENAHWLSDVVVAAGFGLAMAWVAARVVSGGEGLGSGSDLRQNGPVMQAQQSTELLPAEPVRLPVWRETASGGAPSPYASLVIPAYNEQENIPTLLARCVEAMSRLGKPFEIIVVDDGSTDNTPALLTVGLRQYPQLRVIRLSRNTGQSAAFEAGFAAARGQVIATVDADLQNDPEEIPRLIPLLEEKNVDMITGWRKDRQDTPFRRWQSRQANRIRNWISQETVNDSASSLKVYRAHAVKGLKLFNGAHRFLPTLVKMRGYSCLEVPVKHSPRLAGSPKYGFRNRALRGLIDLLAVRWMKSRQLNYSSREIPRPN